MKMDNALVRKINAALKAGETVTISRVTIIPSIPAIKHTIKSIITIGGITWIKVVGEELMYDEDLDTIIFEQNGPAAKAVNEQNQRAETIYGVLFTRKFAEWYKDCGNFGRHVTGDLPRISKPEILEDIKKMFNL